MSAAAEVNHLQYWLNNLKQDPRLTPQQFVAMEKAILLAIALFENNNMKGEENLPYNDDSMEPMKIDYK